MNDFQPAGILDLNQLPPNARGMTRAGRAYNAAAKELQELIQRRIKLIQDYGAQMNASAGLMNEIVHCHSRIDQVLDELSPTPLINPSHAE